jgi:imidazole glycerol-phosphate synthase subunit HisH
VRPAVTVLDYGSGNIRSAERALTRAGADVTVTADFDTALNTDGLFVPGVGAFAACMKGLREVRGDVLIDKRLAGGRPVLGVCVGMQILFEHGDEHNVITDGCGQWPGSVERLRPGAGSPVPHMGWNQVETPGGGLFAGVETERFYFVHSYGVRAWQLTQPRPEMKPGVTWTTYGVDRFVSAVENGPLCATQFHPEKSGDAGAELLRNWLATL